MDGNGRPRILDLFSGAGGCAVGYERAGFEVVGVDIAPQPLYPFEFIQGDAIEVLAHLRAGWDFGGVSLGDFAAIHASPPCQAYTTMNNRHGSSSPPLIAPTREHLGRTGLPYVIENVAGARADLRDPLRLTGEMFGLRVHRPRLFETNWPLMGMPAPPRQTDPVAVYGKQDGRRLWTRADGTELRGATLETAAPAMGIDWMGWDELREAVPPAYCEYIGAQLLAYLEARVAA